ncbi:MAG: cupin domain-containing protein [Candidatus Kariarchaeaceae archaeon]|jgi:quercetin dioxygenase-like cupin family protein
MDDKAIEQIFNSNDRPWKAQKYGKTKFLVGPEISKSGSLRLLFLEPGERFETHEHTFLQTMYFTSGEGILTLDDKNHKISAGLTVIVLPNQCHSIENTGTTDMEIVVYESYQMTAQDTPFIDF